MPRVSEAHFDPEKAVTSPARTEIANKMDDLRLLPLCPGPSEDSHSCGAPVVGYRPPGEKDPFEYDWTVDKPVRVIPCGHVIAAEDLGVVYFRAPETEETPRVRDPGEQQVITRYV